MIMAFTWAFMLQSKLMSTAQRVFKPILFLPQVVPIIASALIWRILLARDFGAINQIMGTSIDFLRDTSIRKWMVVVLMIWRATGWYMIIFLAGVTTVGDEIYDAAKITEPIFYSAFSGLFSR
jgi:ABC-type sugar transport system permease subunit